MNMSEIGCAGEWRESVLFVCRERGVSEMERNGQHALDPRLLDCQ